MVSVTREKIALIVFVLLVFVGIGCLVAYINVGHSWNVTATTIDDATGELDGYTVILYQGVAVEEEEEEEEELDAAKSSLYDDDDADSAESNSASDGAIADEESESQELSGMTSDGVDGQDSSIEEESKSSLGSSSESGSLIEGKTGGSTPLFNSSSKLNVVEEKGPVDVAAAAESYQEKGANVLVLDIGDPSRYDEGTILKRGDRRFGVFSVRFNEPLPKVQAKIDYLKEQSVDFVVAITPDKRFVQKATGIDVVISSKSEGLFFMGETLDGTFYTDSPLVSQVGAVLISPHNVVSSRDITEL